jgi:hypothetical protein
VQTFLPYSDYDQVAQVLDNKRLNKQILESYQILKVLSGQSPTGGWRNHPAVLMWKGHESELYKYAHRMMNEASLRGITITKNYSNLKELEKKCKGMWGKGLPAWFMDNDKLMRVLTTHKVNLFHKDPLYYSSFQPAIFSAYNTPCCEGCKYFWVTHQERNARNKDN